MSRIKLMILFMGVMAGCSPARVIHESQKDSVTYIIKDSVLYRDTVIYIQVEAERDSVVLPDTDISRLSTIYAESEAYVRQGQLHHSLRNKSEALIPVEVKIPVRIHYEEKGMIRYQKIVERIEVEKELNRWQRFMQTLGYVVLIAGIAWLVWKLARLIR